MTLNEIRDAARAWIALATTRDIMQRAIRVGIIVGMILNLINQGDALFGPKDVNWIKFFVTFLVPYSVSTYAGVEALRAREKERAAPRV